MVSVSWLCALGLLAVDLCLTRWLYLDVCGCVWILLAGFTDGCSLCLGLCLGWGVWLVIYCLGLVPTPAKLFALKAFLVDTVG